MHRYYEPLYYGLAHVKPNTELSSKLDVVIEEIEPVVVPETVFGKFGKCDAVAIKYVKLKNRSVKEAIVDVQAYIESYYYVSQYQYWGSNREYSKSFSVTIFPGDTISKNLFNEVHYITLGRVSPNGYNFCAKITSVRETGRIYIPCSVRPTKENIVKYNVCTLARNYDKDGDNIIDDINAIFDDYERGIITKEQFELLVALHFAKADVRLICKDWGMYVRLEPEEPVVGNKVKVIIGRNTPKWYWCNFGVSIFDGVEGINFDIKEDKLTPWSPKEVVIGSFKPKRLGYYRVSAWIASWFA